MASALNAEDRDNASLHQGAEAAGSSGTVSAEVPADESLGVKDRLEQVIVKKAHIGFVGDCPIVPNVHSFLR